MAIHILTHFYPQRTARLSCVEFWFRSHQGDQAARGRDEGEAFSLSLGSRKPTMMITGRLIIAPLVGLLNPGLESLFPTPLLSVCYGHLILMRCVTCAFGRSLLVGLPQGRTAHPSLKGWTIPWDEVLSRCRGAQIWDLPCDAKWKTSFSNLSRYNSCTY